MEKRAAAASGVLVLVLACSVFVTGGASGAPGNVAVCSSDALGAAGNEVSSVPAISQDGRYVAFMSKATNLVPGVSGQQVYRKDLSTGAVILVSCNSGSIPGDADSYPPSISAEGKYVAFSSTATNLVPGASGWQVYRRDIDGGTTVLVSSDAVGNPGGGSSGGPSISADGTYVAFDSDSGNLLPGIDGNQVYRKNLSDQGLALASCEPGGTKGDGSSGHPCISSNGRYVAFDSQAGNLVPGASGSQSYRKDLTGGGVAVASSDAGWTAKGGGGGVLSSDGRYVAFMSSATGLIPGVDGDQVFRKDLTSGAVALVSCDAGGNQGNGSSLGHRLSVSPDGRHVAFESGSTNLLPGVSGWQVYRKDLATGLVALVSCDAGGNPGGGGGNRPALSSGGTYTAFDSASTLIPGVSGYHVYRKEPVDYVPPQPSPPAPAPAPSPAPATPKPKITKLSPSSGKVGKLVTIKGSNFGSKGSSSYVKFASKKVASKKCKSWKASQIKVKVPKGVKGKAKVVVYTSAGKSNSKTFKVKK